MRVPEAGQIRQRRDALMAAVYDRRVQDPCASIANAAQQLMKCGRRIRGETRVRLTNCTVSLSLVMPNETFSRRHDALLRFQNGIC
jgi:hypothetical protein